MNKARLAILFTALVICVIAVIIFHGRFSSTDSVTAAPAQKASADGVWLPVEATELQSRKAADVPDSARTLRLEANALKRVLNTATRETGDSLSLSETVLSLPLPSGEYVSFRIEESPVLDAQLTERYPDIKSYRGVAEDDGSITMRADWTPQGFHALILTADRTYSIVPTSQDTMAEYAAFDAGAAQAVTEEDFQCLVQETKASQENPPVFGRLASVGPSRRNYRLAISTSYEYCNAYGAGTVAGTTASLNTWLNAINAIYERDLNIHFNLVNAPNVLYCAENGYTSATDPYVNGNSPGSMLSQIRPVLRDQVGQTNFDIGHVFGYVPPGTGAGGVAWLGVVCDNGNANGDSLGPIKGGGVSVLSGSLGNTSFLNVIMHEIGHQFGAAHSFNGTTGNCGGGNRSASSGVEPGSGSTIMSYAGNCGSDNVATGSSLRFHAWSFGQVTTYTTTGTGNGCATNSSTGNNAPTVNGGSDYTIPRQTPFELTAVGNDADAADVANLSYGWEQVNAGGNFSNPPYTDAGDAANSTRPLFRSYGPSSSSSRTFPALTYILNNANTPPATYTVGNSTLQTADSLSNINRSLRFRVVARDGRGGATDDEVLLTVNAAAGPFLVTAPNTAVTWGIGSTQTVTWSVNNTNLAPINCANVRILLSTDGGQTFPTVLAASTANDGSEAVTLPGGATSTTARIKVQAVGNVFFDISDANFTLSGVAPTPTPTPMPTPTPTPCPTISLSSLSSGTIETAYNQTITTSASTSPFSFALTAGALPTGLSLNPATGQVSGVPTVSGTFTFTITVSDANTCTGSRAYTLVITGLQFSLQFYPLAAPVRLLDTRPGESGCFAPGAPITGNTSRIQPGRNTCTIPANAVALTGNLTTVASGGGYLTLYPSNAMQPTVASTNFNPNQIINNVFTVGLATTGANAGSFNIFALTNTDVVVDITGYYAPPGAGGLYFHPLPAPIRLLETRPGELGYTTRGAMLPGNADTAQLGRGLTYNGVTIPPSAQALVGNATTVNPGGGYLTLFPQGAARPLAASSNFNAGDIMNAPFTVGLSATGQFMMYVTSSTHLIVDVLGYYSTEATDVNGAGLLFTPLANPVRLLETRAGLPVGCDRPGAPLLAGTTRTQAARGTCTIPATAQGLVGNATTVNPGNGYLTFFPSSVTTPPLVATANFSAGQIINRHFIAGLGNVDGAFKIFTLPTTELVVDVSGYFAP